MDQVQEFGIGKLATIIINIWVTALLTIVLIISGIMTTITAAQMPTNTDALSTAHTLFTISSIVAWISAGLIILIVVVALLLTSGTIILYASFLIVLMAIGIAILCAVIAGLNLYALAVSYGSLSFDIGWYAALGGALAGAGAVLGIGYFIITLALKQPRPASVETVVIV